MFTPHDFEGQLNAFLGNAFSIEPRLTQSALFRPHNRSEDIRRSLLCGRRDASGRRRPRRVARRRGDRALRHRRPRGFRRRHGSKPVRPARSANSSLVVRRPSRMPARGGFFVETVITILSSEAGHFNAKNDSLNVRCRAALQRDRDDRQTLGGRRDVEVPEDPGRPQEV